MLGMHVWATIWFIGASLADFPEELGQIDLSCSRNTSEVLPKMVINTFWSTLSAQLFNIFQQEICDMIGGGT